MKSPFPGMDPYIEACGLWEDFHDDLINEIKRALAEATPVRYFVRTGRRSYYVLIESEGKTEHPFVPDVKITPPESGKKTKKKPGGAAVEEPSTEEGPRMLRAFIAEEHREAFVEIHEAGPEQRLVTTIEVLSPSNKRPGTEGWDLYQSKRQSVLLAGINLVEIDLLRGGQRPPMLDPWPNSPYTLLVARGLSPYQRCKVWPAFFQRPLHEISVPLDHPDADIPLRLQPMIEAIYKRCRYGGSIDYGKPLKPSLRGSEAAWAKAQMREWQKSR
ncbi:MAG TPA: DUF4058 family protein [Gemmataceae bacterium]